MKFGKASTQAKEYFRLIKLPFPTEIIFMCKDNLITCLSDLLKSVTKIKTSNENNILVFRGEKEDFEDTALVPMVYRDGYIEHEDTIYRESERFNDSDFTKDNTTFDKLSRIQHYTAPTRLIDVSEDLFSAIYFAIADINSLEHKSDKTKIKLDKGLLNPVIYIFEINHKKIKYYDSDTVSVVSNLAKIPLRHPNSSSTKSKKDLLRSIRKHTNNEKFNREDSVKYLVHEIRAEKPQFDSIINSTHLTSVHFVLPKLASNRLKSQKGVFLLFGLNYKNVKKPIKILKNNKLIPTSKNTDHPIVKAHILRIDYAHVSEMQEELLKVGIKKPYIYPEIDKVSEYLKTKHKKE